MSGCTLPNTAKPAANAYSGENSNTDSNGIYESPALGAYVTFRTYGRLLARTNWNAARNQNRDTQLSSPSDLRESKEFDKYGLELSEFELEEFFKGRFNRSRARLPENIERWQTRPDVANPGADSANFPNSPFTLPQGRAYIELSPFTYSGQALGTAGQYGTEFLLRYGLTDNMELRVFGNGLSWTEGSNTTTGFSPIGFDTKILLWPEQQDYYLPAVGFEASIQTEWLGSSAFNSGTQPSFTLNFDQSLPFDIDLGYSFSATRFQGSADNNLWTFNFQWALQRDLFNKDFAVFVHGFYQPITVVQNAVGGGFVWTLNSRFGLYGQISAGTTKSTPSLISNVGFAIAF